MFNYLVTLLPLLIVIGFVVFVLLFTLLNLIGGTIGIILFIQKRRFKNANDYN